jgi:SAM-dependent methyltransferase
MMMLTRHDSRDAGYLRAAGRAPLALYDPVVAVTMRERTFRTRLARQLLADWAGDGRRRGLTICDAGCGTGTFATALAVMRGAAAVIGVDGDPAVLERARAKEERARARAGSAPRAEAAGAEAAAGAGGSAAGGAGGGAAGGAGGGAAGGAGGGAAGGAGRGADGGAGGSAAGGAGGGAAGGAGGGAAGDAGGSAAGGAGGSAAGDAGGGAADGAVDWRLGRAEALPLDDESCDRVVLSLVLHHLSPATQQAALAEARRVLRPGGRLHVADWGPPRDPAMRVAFRLLQAIDGVESTAPLARGELPGMLTQAGFGAQTLHDRLRTGWGVLELRSARRG